MKCDRFVGTGISSGNKIHKLRSVGSVSGLPHILENCQTGIVDIPSEAQTSSNKIEDNTTSNKLCPLDVDMLIVIKINAETQDIKEHNSDKTEKCISIIENRVCLYTQRYICII